MQILKLPFKDNEFSELQNAEGPLWNIHAWQTLLSVLNGAQGTERKRYRGEKPAERRTQTEMHPFTKNCIATGLQSKFKKGYLEE